jgi:ABC-type sugar transport system substrate-binding protein
MRAVRQFRRVVTVVAVGLLVAAVAQEAAKPRERRAWRGRVLGVVPYDLNPPTWARMRHAYWNPADRRLFTDRALGVGWAVNLHRARVLLSRVRDRSGREDARPIRLRRPDRG